MPWKSAERRRLGSRESYYKRLVEMTCVDCEAKVKCDPYSFKDGKVARCVSCFRERQRQLRRATRDPGKTEIVSCAVCNTQIAKLRSYLERVKVTTCSVDCLRVAQRTGVVKWPEKLKGPDHPQWKGNTHAVYYGADWRRQSAAARVRDGNACKHCGITRADYKREFDVHHIVRFLDFASSAEANQLTNLITLCRTCHRRADVAQHEEKKAAGIELNGQRRSRRKCYLRFERMAAVVKLFTRNWKAAQAREATIGDENVNGLIAALYAINYADPSKDAGRSRGLAKTPDRVQVCSYMRFVSEIENDCWRFMIGDSLELDSRPWSELLASGDNERIVIVRRTHYLDWENVDPDNYVVTRAGRAGNLPATKREWHVI